MAKQEPMGRWQCQLPGACTVIFPAFYKEKRHENVSGNDTNAAACQRRREVQWRNRGLAITHVNPGARAMRASSVTSIVSVISARATYDPS